MHSSKQMTHELATEVGMTQDEVRGGSGPGEHDVGGSSVGRQMYEVGDVHEGELLWTPSAEQVANTNVAAFLRWLANERGRHFADYDMLWRWSVEDLEGFWGAIWDYFDVQASVPPTRVLGDRTMPGAQWFPGARLNYAEQVLHHERPGATALLFQSETTPVTPFSWDALGRDVRILATQLRELGVRPGDRVVGYLPNTPHAVVVLLAATSIGAIWASCSPDFGWRGALDRFHQLQPKVLVGVDGYRYGGKDFDRRDQLRAITTELDSLEQVVYVPYLYPDTPEPPEESWLRWDDVLDHPPVPAEEFEFAQVPFDHPLWVLFSSGTTGPPKALVHGHGGITVEQLKLQSFHMELGPGDRVFFFTTTGWMMWNFLVSTLLLGGCPVLYDGNPAYPHAGVLWQMSQDCGVNLFGSSPAYVDAMVKAGVVPGEEYDLSRLRTIMPAGSPVSPECSAWFYRNVKHDLWLATGSGGTDCCCGLVGGVATKPVYAGEIQAPSLGVAAAAYNERGESVTDEVGELVLTQPMPSMPLYLWGDRDNVHYREAYFADFPGVWRHGDFFRINQRGGCFVLGRSDATLNRQGVRIGTAEIYRALEPIEEIDDAVVVSLELPDTFFMPLFVALTAGRELDASLEGKIRDRLRREYTPRHVPDRIIQVPEIPATLTGKKMEVPVRKILLGVPADEAANRNAMSEPRALDAFIEYARTQQDYSIT